MEDFSAFPSIPNIKKLYMCITQKMHGTNAQIYVEKTTAGEFIVKAGSRNRWLEIGDDNFGFAAYVAANRHAIIEHLGIGRHFGEWCGPGINGGGEGLTERKLFLFNHFRWEMIKHHIPQMDIVPVLHTGPVNHDTIEIVLNRLKENGSKAVPGYMLPEGIVVQVGDQFWKRPFIEEEVKWKGMLKAQKPKVASLKMDVSHLLQPIRLEKLLSKDERYRRNYPESLADICKDYTADLVSDEQFDPADTVLKKSLGGQLFAFVKQEINK